MNFKDSLRIQAHANRLINHRLHGSMAALPADAFQAPRTSFFPSLAETLNHILGVDLYYVAAMEGDARADLQWQQFVPAASLAELAVRQAAVDSRLIALCTDGCDPTREVQMPRRAGHIQRDSLAAVLMHLFMHQHHHRGQVHAMLSGTGVAPPQLDEFMMSSEAHLRETDMAALGLDERSVYGANYGAV